MKLQATTDIRIRVNGEKKDFEAGDVVEVKDNDIDQIRFLKLNGWKEVTEIQTTDASNDEVVEKKGKVARKK